jgi:hypothetical protein
MTTTSRFTQMKCNVYFWLYFNIDESKNEAILAYLDKIPTRQTRMKKGEEYLMFTWEYPKASIVIYELLKQIQDKFPDNCKASYKVI